MFLQILFIFIFELIGFRFWFNYRNFLEQTNSLKANYKITKGEVKHIYEEKMGGFDEIEEYISRSLTILFLDKNKIEYRKHFKTNDLKIKVGDYIDVFYSESDPLNSYIKFEEGTFLNNLILFFLIFIPLFYIIITFFI